MMPPHPLRSDPRCLAGQRDGALTVATVMRRWGETGVQTHTNAFLDYLAVRGRPVSCITPFCGTRMAYPVFAVRALLKLTRRREASVRWYRYWHGEFLRRALRRALGDGHPRVIYAQDPVAAKAALDARTTPRQRVAMAVHFCASQAEEWAAKGMLRKGGAAYDSIRRLERSVLPRLDGLVYVSDFTREALTRAQPDLARIPSIVIPNFVSRPAAETVTPTRDLISIGSLVTHKNQEYLLRMLAAANELGRRLWLTIVGNGPERSRLESLAKTLGVAEQAQFTGYRANAAEMIPAHRVYCHASRIESFGIALIEAMARGVPVVAAPVGGVCEVFEPGTEGLHWDLDDPAAGAQQALRLLDDAGLRAQMGEAARRRFERCFTTEAVAPQLEEFLLGLGAEPASCGRSGREATEPWSAEGAQP